MAPLLANWFVTTIENNILSAKEHDLCKPSYYRRYVDDIFAVFSSETSRDAFFEVLNNAHSNLIFTMEISTGALPFLDTQVTIKHLGFQVEVYRKPTNTDVVMNYDSSAPPKWKRALINCLLLRAYNISSSFSLFKKEVERVKTTLQRNSYPDYIVNQAVNAFILRNNITVDAYKIIQVNDDHHTPSKDPKEYFTIPYVGRPSLKLQRRIHEEMKKHDLTTLASYTTTKVGSYFNLKSGCSSIFKANVVYEFTCACDKSCSYIGETQRQLFRRITEHSEPSKTYSAIFEHLQGCSDCQNEKNICSRFKIMQHCNKWNVTSYESLLISKYRPKLNTQLGPGNGTIISLALYN